MDSILTSIKKRLGGLSEKQTDFDHDIIEAINYVFPILRQIGVGPKGFRIEDDGAIWNDYIEDPDLKGMVETYIYTKVKLVFDPPANATLVKLLEEQAKELEWRMNVMVDPENQNGVE